MSKHTLTLSQKPAAEPAIAAAKDITAADVMEWLKKNTLPVAPVGELAPKVADPSFDWKYDAPVESKPFDLSTLDPRTRTVPVQLPPKTWGNPRFVTPP